ncbi:9911_t:CDS:2 [Paraglomus brasilianum]|uniref:9911_t:CDS:1 n=1 Tax=Paraglomus brasilianum TaxID=144538 RepID=A0A9N8VW13_9GLOM|nr:9911_t:CDS:2 [Paraglomus brasilianum]
MLIEFLRDSFNIDGGAEYQPIVSNTSASSQHSGEQDRNTPADRYKIVYWIFTLQGISILLSWNAFITASEFFYKEFEGSPFKDTFQNYFSIVSMVVNLICQSHALYQKTTVNLAKLVTVTLLVNVVVYILTTISTKVLDEFTSTSYFYFIITMLIIIAASNAYLQNAFFGLASSFPPLYMQAALSGEAIVGVAVSIVQLFSAWATEKSDLPSADLQEGAFYYFLAVSGTAVMAAVSFIALRRMRFYRHYSQLPTEQALPNNSTNSPSISGTFRLVRTHAYANALVFLVTLALFPSITASIRSVSQRAESKESSQNDLFIPFHFLIFNVGDWLGRVLIRADQVTSITPNSLLKFSLLRFIFFPLFLMCNVVVGSTDTRLFPLLIYSDFLYFCILFAFALSNGYLGSLIMMAAPQYVDDERKGVVGMIMVMALSLGLTAGSLLSFPLKAASCLCNPFTV